MRKYGAFLVEDQVYRTHEQPLAARDLEGATVDPVTGVVQKGGQAIGVEIDGRRHLGFPTPSRKLEFFSGTLKAWKWPEEAVPNYIRSHVHWSNLDRAKGEMVLLPTFRPPTPIHTRSGNAKRLYEISHTNPLWMHPEDAARAGVATGDLLKVSTRIGHFVDRVWVTESVRPGVIACSHHLGRWRLHEDAGGERWSTSLVDLAQPEPGKWRMRQVHGPRPFSSDDPDPARPGQRPALLAPEGDRVAARSRRSIRRRVRGYEPLVRGLSRVAGPRAPGAGPGQPEASAVAAAGVQARRVRLPAGRRLRRRQKLSRAGFGRIVFSRSLRRARGEREMGGMTEDHQMTRRTALGALGALGVVAAGGFVVGAPATARAQVLGLNESVQETMKRLFGDRPIKDGEAVIKVDFPPIAENGSVVPISVTVESPMTPASYVRHIYVVADKNRIPFVTRATLAPEAGRAFMGANIRLGETGDLRAIVEQSDGTLLMVKREVKVTVGGCGG